MEFERRRVLIWGKTYPELSWHHLETVCTGGCLEDGSPIRLYPISLRQLPNHQRYSLYHWIEIPIAKSQKDGRPESYKVRDEDIQVISKVGPEHGWAERRQTIFRDRSWHYECIEDIRTAQKRNGTSLGMVKVGEVTKVRIVTRAAVERKEHERKLRELQSVRDLFGRAQKELAFVSERVQVEFKCQRMVGRAACPGHKMQVLDWGLGELWRKSGSEAAKSKMEELADLGVYDLRFFMGNFKGYPQNFGVLGLWYPKKKHMQQEELFAV